MKKLFYLCFVVIVLLATGCKNDDVSPVKQIHLELSHDNISINAGGGSASVTVYCNDSWEVYGSCDWCSPSLRSGMANDEDGTVVNFEAKESYAPREAIFYFMCGEICLELKVTQEQKNVIFADEQNIFNIPASGGVALIEYKTNVLCGVVIPTEAEDWISLTSTRALRDESMGLYIAPNETYDSRSATIMIVAIGDNTLCAEYTINQVQKDIILAGEDNKFIVSSDGGDVNIDFETNVNYKVNIPSNARDWITLVEPTRGVSPHNIVLRVAKNKTYDKRSAVISITKSGASNPTVEYTIEQMQNDDIVFEGDVLLAPAKGGSVVLDYQANIDCEVIIPDEVKDWISIEPQTRGLEQYSVTLVLAPNDSFDERTATIKVEGETVSRDIEVKQMGIERVLSLSPSTLDLPLDATTVTVEVETNIDYEVVIPEDCDWITIPESESASENKVIFAITENPTIYSRDTEILFKGDGKDVVLPVIQRGDEGIIILNEEYIVDGQETVLSIEFGSNFDYTVSIPDTCDWLSLPETRAVIQNHTIDFVLTKNPNLDSRSVEILFSDTKEDVSKSVKITQLGSPLYCVVPNDNEILYKTTDGEKLNISETGFGSATVVSHTYEDGVGRITCSSNITELGNKLFYHCSTLEQVAIPDSVTTIGDYAFSGCSSLTSVTIPDSVTWIRNSAFSGCSSLTSVTIPDSVTTIGSFAFDGCSSLTSVTISDSVTTIASYAFRNCKSLESVTIPDSVTAIGYRAFYGCSSLTSVTIPDSVTGIGEEAFYGCSSLTSVTIPDSVTTIGKWTFYDCSSLTSVTIGDNVTTIGERAFYNCTSLTSINIPESVTSIGKEVFYGCTGELIINNKIVETDYTDNNYPSYYGWLKEAKFTKLTIGDSVTTIGNYAFRNCSSLTSVTISDSVTEIGEGAFQGCSSLTSVTIPDSVTEIGEGAFKGCSSLTSVTIPDSVTGIGKEAFYGCTGKLIINNKIVEKDYDSSNYPFKTGWLYGSKFTSLIIGNGVTEIGDYAFYGCSSLTSVTIGDSVTSIGNSTFNNCSSLTSVTMPDSVTTIGYSAFRSCSSLTSVTIPDSVTTIGNDAFYNCNSLTSVTIGDSVTTIGNDAFWLCSSLTSVYINDIAAWCNISFGNLHSNPLKYAHNLYLNNELVTDLVIPDSVTTIGKWALYWCVSLTSVTIPDSVTTIGEEAFWGCESLTSVTIPDSVTTIGEEAFSYCSSLTSVYIDDIATWCNISFSGLGSNPLYYADNLYLNNELVTDLTIPNGVTTIGNYAFNVCISLTSVTIPNSVTTIGNEAFSSCYSLKSVTIPDSVTTIGYRGFLNCYSLTSVTIPDSVTTIGERAFYNCSSLKSINIPESVTSIGEEVFYNCTGELIVNCNIPSASSSEYGAFYGSEFTKVTIGNCVTSIGDYAFYGCTSLKSINIPESVTSIGKEVFYGCTGELIINNKIVEKDHDSSNYPFKTGWLYCSKFTSLIIGNGVTSIGNYAFYGCSSLTSVTISDSVTTIGEKAFSDCRSLTSVIIGNSVTTIGESAFNGCTGELIINSKIVETDYTYNNYPSYYGWLKEAKFTKLTIGDSVTSIGSYAFRGCSSLTSVTIPDSVTSIGDWVFQGCISLTSVTIPDSVTTIGENAFNWCDSLTSITIGDGVTSIGSYAFEYCTSLTRVTIPDSVTSIGNSAFENCRSLRRVYCKATTPPAGGSSMFSNNASDLKIYVPTESVNKYKSASYWSWYADAIVGYNF